MFGKKLRQRIKDLETKLEQAATYTDSSTFDCPLCDGITEVNPIPTSYCSLHHQIGMLEKENQEIRENHKKEIDELVKTATILMEISNEHRMAIDNIMLASTTPSLNLRQKQTETLGALVSKSEVKIQSLARLLHSDLNWMYKLKYPDKI